MAAQTGSTTETSVTALPSITRANPNHPWQMSTLWVKLLHINFIPEASFSLSFFSLTERKHWNVFCSILSNGWISFKWEIKGLSLFAGRFSKGAGQHAHSSSSHNCMNLEQKLRSKTNTWTSSTVLTEYLKVPVTSPGVQHTQPWRDY